MRFPMESAAVPLVGQWGVSIRRQRINVEFFLTDAMHRSQLLISMRPSTAESDSGEDLC